MIDLHLHTTASDGRLTPSELVARASAVGLTTISVTDHDTVAGLAEVRQHAAAMNVTLVAGIEITAVHADRDVHMLGYFFDEGNRALLRFLEASRARRVERIREIGARLARLGAPVNVERLLENVASRPGVSVGRPVVARALIEAGHVGSLQEAFDRYLGAGQPAFVPRVGSSPAVVVDVIHAAGGVASLAHPGVTKQPALIPPLAAHGLDAIEAYHSDHTPEMKAEALATAQQLHLAVSGGSDFHGDNDRRRPLGGVTLPQDAFDDLSRRAADARTGGRGE